MRSDMLKTNILAPGVLKIVAPENRRVTVQGVPIVLGAKEFAAVHTLARAFGCGVESIVMSAGIPLIGGV